MGCKIDSIKDQELFKLNHLLVVRVSEAKIELFKDLTSLIKLDLLLVEKQRKKLWLRTN